MKRTGLNRSANGRQRTIWQNAWQGKPCRVCGERAVHGHHILHLQHCRLYGAPKWSPKNCMPLCFRCHERHHNAFRRIPRSLLPQEAIEFAGEFGAVETLYRYYPEDVN